MTKATAAFVPLALMTLLPVATVQARTDIGTTSIGSNTTWNPAGSPYVICGTVTVSPGVTLTVASGTIVKLDFNDICKDAEGARSKLSIDGKISADGASFTSYRDDSIGGDTNGDGAAPPAPVPSPGDWYGIRFNAGSDSTSAITNCVIKYATNGVQINGAGVNPTIMSNTFSWNQNGVYVSIGRGFIKQNSFDKFESGINALSPTTPDVDTNTFNTNKTNPLSFTEIPAALRVGAGFLGGLGGNTSTGNGINGVVLIAEPIPTSVTWVNNSLPYVMCGTINVPTGVTLSVQYGTLVKAASSFSFTGLPCGNTSLTVNGTLNVGVGITPAPVNFTSLSDDATGGLDTNGDGAATTPVRGDWGGIVFKDGGGGNVTQAVVKYAVNGMVMDGAGANPTINGNTFSKNSTGIYLNNGGGTVSANHFDSADQGVWAVGGTTNVTGNIFSTAGQLGGAVPVPIRLEIQYQGIITGNTSTGSGINAIVVSETAGHATGTVTWSETSLAYALCGSVTVATGGTLTVSAGVVVKGAPGAASSALGCSGSALLSISGNLAATGATFTSYYDDAVKGDTNGDGSATTPGLNDWGGIQFNAGSGGTSNSDVFKYCTPAVTINGAGANPTINGSTFTQNGTSVYLINGAGTISGSSFDHMTTGVNGLGGTTHLVNNHFNTSPTVSAPNPFAFFMDVAFPGTITGNTSTGAGINGIVMIADTIAAPISWTETTMAYIVCGSFNIANGGSLTIGPGAVVKVAPLTFGPLGCPKATPTIFGTLNVSGSQAHPVNFTSLSDDTLLGDSNGDGNASTPAIGDWVGLQFHAGGTGTITNAVFKYGSDAVWLDDPAATPTISNSTFTNNTKGVTITGGAGLVQGNTFNVVSSGIYVTAATTTIQSNTFNTNGSNTAAMRFTSIFQSSLTGNVSTGTGVNGAVVYAGGADGPTTANLTWAQTSMPYVICGPLALAPGISLGVSAGVVIKSAPSTFAPLGCGANGGLAISGSLNVTGTAPAPVVFTSLSDDTVGGDTNGDGHASTPVTADWGGVQFSGGSSGTITGAILRYAATALATTGAGVSPTITGSTFTLNNIGLQAAGGSTPHVHQSNFLGNHLFGAKNGDCPTAVPTCVTPDVDATSNFWGSATGPNLNGPGGASDGISFHVNATSFAGTFFGSAPFPVLISPGLGANVGSTLPTFTWSSVTGAAGYRIMIASQLSALPTDPNGTCSGCTVNTTTAVTSYTPSAGVLLPGTSYWQVQSSTGPGAWSAVFSFSTTTTTTSSPPSVSIDTPAPGATVSGVISVAGWALDNTSAVGTAITLVQVQADGITLGNANYGLPRPDVCANYPGRPGCPNVGYSFSLNTALLSPGSHTITVSATDSDATPSTGSSSVGITVAGSGSAGTLTLSRKTLNFGTSGQVGTSAQTITLTFIGGSPVNWTASSNQPNISVTPGSGGTNAALQISATAGASGIVTVTAPGASNSPQQIQVNVTTANSLPPFGSFDTPGNNSSGIAGAVAVTGWALDNIEVASVGIWREPVGSEPVGPNGFVFLGSGTFVTGARPDVEAAFPATPQNYRAGWGYMLLTNFLPNTAGSGPSGNGTYKLHAIAVNKAGQTLDLGIHSITVDNAHAAKPFGTIDTPGQGGTVSGNAYVNFGWALTQNPYCIATDGSTMTVTVDGVTLGHPNYNQLRSDIASSFPGLCNSNGAIGFFYIDTTKLANGVHTIGWLVFDNQGRGDGIGSRFFTVANTGAENVPATDDPIPADSNNVVKFRRGFDLYRNAEPLKPDAAGEYFVDMEELDRVELEVGATSGYLLVNGERQTLPIGSNLRGGTFIWHPGPGFLGLYELLFERADGTLVHVRVVIQPKSYNKNGGVQ